MVDRKPERRRATTPSAPDAKAASATGDTKATSTETTGAAAPADIRQPEPEGTTARNQTAAQINDLRFELLRNIAYHGDRERWFSSLDRWAKVLGALFSLSAVIGLLGRVPMLVETAVAVVATVQLVDLVIDSAKIAREARGLRQRFVGLLTEIERGDADAGTVAQWRAAMTQIYADEGPTMRAVDAIAWNHAADATGRGTPITVTRWQRATRHIFGWADLKG